MTIQEEIEKKLSPEIAKNNEKSSSVDVSEENKDAIDNVLDLPTREEILEKYRVIGKNRQDNGYKVLEEIKDLPAFMYLMEKSFLQNHRARGSKDLLSEEIISKYYILGDSKSVFNNLQFFGHELLNTNMDPYEMYNFLRLFNINKLEKCPELYNNISKSLLSFRVNKYRNFRDLITKNIDKYIYLKENISGFTIDSLKNEYKVVNSVFYVLLELDNIEIFIELMEELKVTNVNDEWFDVEVEELYNLYKNIFKTRETIENLKLLNKNLNQPLNLDVLIGKQEPYKDLDIDNLESIFKINYSILEKVLNLISKENINLKTDGILNIISTTIIAFSIDDDINEKIEEVSFSVLNILDGKEEKNENKSGRNQKETFELIEFLYDKFGEDFFEEEHNLLKYIVNTKFDKKFIKENIFDKYNIFGREGVLFLKVIFTGSESSNLEMYQSLEKEAPEVFGYENFIKNFYLDHRFFRLATALFNIKKADNFVYMFKKYSKEISENLPEFLAKIKNHIELSGEKGIGLKNLESIENIFGFDVSYNDFIKSEGIFLVGADLENEFEYLNSKFPGKIKSLDDLREFHPFYSNFKEVTEYHKFFINKLSYKKNDFQNNLVMKELSSLDETAKEIFEKLENIFGFEVLLRYIGKKENIANALLYSEKLISIGKSAKELLLFIGDSKEIRKYSKISLILNMFHVSDEINIKKVLKILELRGINISKSLINAFNFTKTLEEEKEVLDLFDKTLDNLISLKPIDSSEYKFLVNGAINEVYNGVRSYTPEKLDDYENKNEHLDKYKFDRNGYKMFFSGLTGFKLKEGKKSNIELMKIFDKRVEKIKIISKNIETLKGYILKEFEKSQFKTQIDNLEALIMQYLKFLENKKGKLDIEDMDVILAYQLLGKFDDFINGSNDKIAQIQDKYSENVYKLDALINEYGDNLKETINLLEKKLINLDNKKDVELLSTKLENTKDTNEYKNLTKNRVFEQIIKSFINIPDDKLNIKIIEKSLITRFSTVLQKNSYLKNKVGDLVSMFDLDDFRFLDNENSKNNLKEKLKSNVVNFLSNNKQINLDLKMIKDIQGKIYTKLKHENDKYEEIKEIEKKSNGKMVEKSSKIRNVVGYFSKTKEQAKARGVGGVCIGKDYKMWKNPNYFEFVLMDIDRNVNIGTTMLLNIEDNNKKYLLFGPNPSEEFTAKVSSTNLYYQILERVSKFAEENGYDGIILNTEYGRSTNRGGSFQTVLEKSVLKDNNGEALIINLQKSHLLGGGYEYKDGLNFVWKNSY